MQTIFCDNYFPPIFIECYKYGEDEYINKTEYTEPNDGNYGNNIVGIWRVKYKKLDPNYYLKGQLN